MTLIRSKFDTNARAKDRVIGRQIERETKGEKERERLTNSYEKGTHPASSHAIFRAPAAEYAYTRANVDR